MPAPSPASSALPLSTLDASLEAFLAERDQEPHWIYVCILFLLTLAAVALPLVRVDVTVRASGIIRPTTAPIGLQTGLGGLIERVWITDNQPVKAGQPLIQLRSIEIESRLALNEERLRAATDLLCDLTLLAATPATEDLEPDPTRFLPNLRTAALGQEWLGYRTQRIALQLAVLRAASYHDRVAKLAAKGWSTQQELELARFEREQADASLRHATQQARSGWLERQRIEEATLDNLRSDQRRLQEEADRHIVRAPVTGMLMEFAGWAPGSYLPPGQPIGRISPDDDLQVEAMISPQDAGLVRPGQSVRLLIDALPHTYWGALTGTVRSVSTDLTTGLLTASPGFKVLIEPHSTVLARPDGRRAELRKGLTLTARMVVAQRSLLQLLYDEAGGWTQLLNQSPEPTPL